MELNPNTAIALLGGSTEAARFFEVTVGAVSQWRENGIPKARAMYLRAARPDVYQESLRTAAEPQKVAA
jgi:DNA-binding transcriptional regulator YdaS (Cro superfamily)